MKQVRDALQDTVAAQIWALTRIDKKAILKKTGEVVTIKEVQYGQANVTDEKGNAFLVHVFALAPVEETNASR